MQYQRELDKATAAENSARPKTPTLFGGRPRTPTFSGAGEGTSGGGMMRGRSATGGGGAGGKVGGIGMGFRFARSRSPPPPAAHALPTIFPPPSPPSAAVTGASIRIFSRSSPPSQIPAAAARPKTSSAVVSVSASTSIRPSPNQKGRARPSTSAGRLHGPGSGSNNFASSHPFASSSAAPVSVSAAPSSYLPPTSASTIRATPSGSFASPSRRRFSIGAKEARSASPLSNSHVDPAAGVERAKAAEDVIDKRDFQRQPGVDVHNHPLPPRPPTSPTPAAHGNRDGTKPRSNTNIPKPRPRPITAPRPDTLDSRVQTSITNHLGSGIGDGGGDDGADGSGSMAAATRWAYASLASEDGLNSKANSLTPLPPPVNVLKSVENHPDVPGNGESAKIARLEVSGLGYLRDTVVWLTIDQVSNYYLRSL